MIRIFLKIQWIIDRRHPPTQVTIVSKHKHNTTDTPFNKNLDQEKGGEIVDDEVDYDKEKFRQIADYEENDGKEKGVEIVDNR